MDANRNRDCVHVIRLRVARALLVVERIAHTHTHGVCTHCFSHAERADGKGRSISDRLMHQTPAGSVLIRSSNCIATVVRDGGSSSLTIILTIVANVLSNLAEFAITCGDRAFNVRAGGRRPKMLIVPMTGQLPDRFIGRRHIESGARCYTAFDPEFDPIIETDRACASRASDGQ